MTTDQAFTEMINQRAIHRDLDISSDLVRTYRAHLKNGRHIKMETKMELLKRAGYKLVQEPVWSRG